MEFIKTRAFPTFFQDYAPKLIEFFGTWVDWLNEPDNAGYVIDHLSSEQDIDESIDAYKTHLKKNLLSDYPDSISSDLKLLLKNIFYLYNAKSSIKSYDFLFRCLFNSPAHILYPKDNILRASDGRWNVPKYISVVGYDLFQNLKLYNSYMIIGNESKTTAYLNGGTVYVYTLEDGSYATRNSMNLASVDGKFIPGEHLTIKNPETDEIIEIPELTVEFYEEAQGTWEGTKGFLNSDMVIQDSYYYQDFSYIIKSNVSIHRWRNIVKSIIHPAGLELFGDLLLSEDGDGVSDVYVNPTEFLRCWHILFKMYVFETTTKIEFHNWVQSLNTLAQRHSETQDAWLYYGLYHAKDSYNQLVVNDMNNTFNRSSVLLFRDDGTLIHPNIINWALFEFEEDINTDFLYGLTLNPQSHILSGTINGNSWKPEYDESFIENNFMMFITDTSSTQNTQIKTFVVDNEYLKYDDEHPEGKEYLVRETYLSDKALKFPEELSEWRKLTTKDYIATNKETEKFFDTNSLLKVPDAFISTSENKYVVENNSYDNENLVIFSYSPRDFTHRIFINRENNKVDIYYTNFSWYQVGNPSNPILDSNLQVTDKSFSGSADSSTDIYQCESISYDDEGNVVNLQQTQFTLELPYNVDENNVLLFVNGLYSNDYRIKNNTVFIDTEDSEREIIFYIQDNGTITSDKNGEHFLYLLDKVNLFFNDDGVQYFVQDNGYITRDYLGEEIEFVVKSYQTISDMSGTVVFYLQNDGTITRDEAGNEISYYLVNDKISYDEAGKEVVFYKQSNGDITIDEEGTKVLYKIQSYRTISDLSGNASYYWQVNDTITSDVSGLKYVYTSRNYQVIIDKTVIKYFIQENRTVTTDIFGKEVLYYVQPDNVITTSYILYNSSEINFDDCTLETIVSKSETNTSKLEDVMLLDELVIELDNAVTKEFGDFVLNEVLYYIYGVEQTRKHSTAELYLLSPLNAMRKQMNTYGKDKKFIYNSAVLSPFGLYNTQIEHFHVIDLSDDFMKIESSDWLIRWYKLFHVDTNMIKNRVMSITIPAQNHSETMDNIFTRNFIDLYNLTNLTEEELLSKLNQNSLLVFDKDGSLIPKLDIDWHNMTIKENYEILYSLQLMPENVYLSNSNKDTNYFIFSNGKKLIDGEKESVVQDIVTKLFSLGANDTLYKSKHIDNADIPILDNLGNLTVDELIRLKENLYKKLGYSNSDTELASSTSKLSVYYYNKDFISEYYYNTTENVIYLTDKGHENISESKLSNITADTLIELSDGNVERLKNVTFTQLVNSEHNKPLYVMTGNDIVNMKDGLLYVDTNYILVFVDGKYTRNWGYRTNGSIVLYDTPKETSEIYILNSLDYNSQDVLYKDKTDESFTFNNMRLNRYAPREMSIVDDKLMMTSTDLLFINHQIKNLKTLSQTVHFWRQYIKYNSFVYPNIMLHYTMDRLLRDGTFDVFPYTSSSIIPSDDETVDTNMNEITYLESKFNKNMTMLFDDKGLLINPKSIDWSITKFNIPQPTKYITTVCLNGNKPAIIGDLLKTNLRSIKTSEADILLDVAQSQLNTNRIELLSTQDNVVSNPYSYDTDKLENIGNTDYLYYKISNDAFDTLYVNEDDFIAENIFAFVNGKKVYKDDITIQVEGNCYIVSNFEKYNGNRNSYTDIGSMKENDFIMDDNNEFCSINTLNGDSDVLEFKNNIETNSIDELNQKSLVITQKTNSKECVIFQYNPNDIESIVEVKHPSYRIFSLPNVGYMKQNLLVFVNGIRTNNYFIEGNKLVFPNNITLDTVEIYVFKKYDYLFVEDNKYNQNYYNFIVQNIKRSLFF